MYLAKLRAYVDAVPLASAATAVWGSATTAPAAPATPAAPAAHAALAAPAAHAAPTALAAPGTERGEEDVLGLLGDYGGSSDESGDDTGNVGGAGENDGASGGATASGGAARAATGGAVTTSLAAAFAAAASTASGGGVEDGEGKAAGEDGVGLGEADEDGEGLGEAYHYSVGGDRQRRYEIQRQPVVVAATKSGSIAGGRGGRGGRGGSGGSGGDGQETKEGGRQEGKARGGEEETPPHPPQSSTPPEIRAAKAAMAATRDRLRAEMEAANAERQDAMEARLDEEAQAQITLAQWQASFDVNEGVVGSGYGQAASQASRGARGGGGSGRGGAREGAPRCAVPLPSATRRQRKGPPPPRVFGEVARAGDEAQKILKRLLKVHKRGSTARCAYGGHGLSEWHSKYIATRKRHESNASLTVPIWKRRAKGAGGGGGAGGTVGAVGGGGGGGGGASDAASDAARLVMHPVYAVARSLLFLSRWFSQVSDSQMLRRLASLSAPGGPPREAAEGGEASVP